MNKHSVSLSGRLTRLLCCVAVLLAGCAGIEPTSDQTPSGQSAKTSRFSRSTGAGQIERVELKDGPKAQTVDLTNAPDDVFQRIRRGFGMPDINDDLVLYHQQWYLNRPDYLRRMVDRSSRYLYHIVDELERRGMPTEIALLPMVESAYNPMAYSRSKASGLWQFIPATGKRYKLDQNWWKDERRDVVASTAAALDYLQSIYEMHGDWHLALASYNWGEGAVGRAIGKNRAQGLPTDYLSLTMPSETRNYVPKLQALKNIFRNPAQVAELSLPSVPNRPFFGTVTTDSHIDVKMAAKLAGMPVEEFVALNPAHNRPVIKPDSTLVIPAEKLETFVSNLEARSDDNKPLSVWQTYTLGPGEKLEKVASRFGMSIGMLKAVNGIQGKTRPAPGTTLLVAGTGRVVDKTELAALPEQPRQPEAEARSGSKERAPAEQAVHTVKKGETLATVAKRYNVSATEIKKINKLKGEKLTAGMRLQLASAATVEAKPAASEKKASPNNEKGKDASRKSVEKTTPGKIVLTKAETTRTSAKSAQKTTRYVVRRGDTIYSIARQFKVAVNDLIRHNDISAGSLKPGTTLTILLADNS